MESFNESKLIKGMINRDKECLVKIMNHYGNLVYYIASNILKEAYEKDNIEDCYNEVFTAIWFNIDCFNQEKGSFKTWIISITKYKALDIKRKVSKYNQALEYKDEVTANEGKDLERIENLEFIRNLFDNLQEKDKVIFLKRYLEGHSIKEISEALGYSEEYIYTRISRARKKIKKMAGEFNG